MEIQQEKLQEFFKTIWSSWLQDFRQQLTHAEVNEDLTKCAVDFVRTGGKRIRPILFLASWEIFSECCVFDAGSQQGTLTKTALALELLHTFILVHDDVIDRSLTRRGRPTLHRLLEQHIGVNIDKHFAQSIAVIIGDILFADAIRFMIEGTKDHKHSALVQQLFLQVVRDTGHGELIETTAIRKKFSNVNLSDVERIYYYKTTRYTIELPIITGYLLADGDQYYLGVLEKYSQKIGLAFQILNDLTDFQKTYNSTTEVEGDIVEAKKTWLLVKMRELLGEADRKFLDEIFERHPRDNRFVYKVRYLIEKTNTTEHALNQVNSLLLDAEKFVMQYELPSSYTQKLISLTKVLRLLVSG